MAALRSVSSPSIIPLRRFIEEHTDALLEGRTVACPAERIESPAERFELFVELGRPLWRTHSTYAMALRDGSRIIARIVDLDGVETLELTRERWDPRLGVGNLLRHTVHHSELRQCTNACIALFRLGRPANK